MLRMHFQKTTYCICNVYVYKIQAKHLLIQQLFYLLFLLYYIFYLIVNFKFKKKLTTSVFIIYLLHIFRTYGNVNRENVNNFENNRS